jgi:hypothetical protein
MATGEYSSSSCGEKQERLNVCFRQRMMMRKKIKLVTNNAKKLYDLKSCHRSLQ